MKTNEVSNIILLKEILQANNFTYRNILNLPNYITFGLEIEFEHADKEKIYRNIKKNFLEWIIKSDDSLENGLEINSPILNDNLTTWQTLKKVCLIVSKYATIGTNSAGHIHIGSQVLGEKETSWLNFIKLWSAYENIIFKFSYGEYLNPRPNIKEYSEPLMKYLKKDYETLKSKEATLYEIINEITHLRSQAVNFQNIKINNINQIIKNNTIEFRCPNGSLNPTIWQNNIKLFTSLLLYAKSDKFNHEIVERRLNQNNELNLELSSYNALYLEQALELCNLIFQNNIDKMYFLKQYTKCL